VLLRKESLTRKGDANDVLEVRAWVVVSEDEATGLMGGFQKLVRSIRVKMCGDALFPEQHFLFVSADSKQFTRMRTLQTQLGDDGFPTLSARELYLCGDQGGWQSACIERSSGVLLCLSDRSLLSQWVEQEVRYARDVYNKPFFPVVLDKTQFTEKATAAALMEKRAWAYVHADEGQEQMGGYDKLLQSLRVRLDNEPRLSIEPFFYVSAAYLQGNQVRILKEALKAVGISCLTARELYMVGDNATWSYEPINACAGMIACWSDKYVRSRFTQRELAYASTHTKAIISVVLDPAALTEASAAQMHDQLHGLGNYSKLAGHAQAEESTIHHFRDGIDRLGSSADDAQTAMTLDAVASRCTDVLKRLPSSTSPKNVAQ